MATLHKIEVYAVVDSNGEYAVGTEAEAALENYTDAVGGLESVEGFRVVKLVVNVPLPEMVTLAGTVSETEEATLELSK